MMKSKRLWLTCLCVFVAIFGYDFVLHNVLLKTDYVVTGYLWRSPEEMGKYFGFLLFGQLLLSVVFCFLYAFLIDQRSSVRNGLIYGFLAGLLLSAPNFIMFTVQPMPGDLILVKWTIGRLLQTLLAGFILGLVYRPPSLKQL